MAQSITTSIRLDEKLSVELDKAALKLHRGKNWIIVKALEEYLRKVSQKNLVPEAKRQSLLANEQTIEEETWEQNADDRGWK